MRTGDIFFWRYTKNELESLGNGRNGGTTYWCCSQIAVYDGERLVDTYWHGGGGNVVFKPEDVEKKIILVPVANYDELEVSSHIAYRYYSKLDVVDLRHANNSSDRNVFIRRGAEKNLEAMKKYLEQEVAESERKAKFEAGHLERLKEKLAALCEENKNDFYI